TVLERLGRVEVLVNAAGFATRRTAIVKSNIADCDRTLATCLRAPMNLTRLVLPDMIAHRQGAIVNIVSAAARHGRAGESVYAAAKAGLLAFTQSLREEVGEQG